MKSDKLNKVARNLNIFNITIVNYCLVLNGLHVTYDALFYCTFKTVNNNYLQYVTKVTKETFKRKYVFKKIDT